MKSHAHKIILNVLDRFLNVDRRVHLNSLKMKDRIVKWNAILMKLGGKTYEKSISK